jgi:nucleotide-binding universal stress UspA family protein
MTQMKKILVGIDGSLESGGAAKEAAVLAQTSGGTVTLMYVAPEQDLVRYGPKVFMRISRTIPEGVFDRAKAEMEARNVPYETVVETGRAFKVLLERSREFDLLVMGTRELGPMARFFMGSVSAPVIHRTKVPTIVVP